MKWLRGFSSSRLIVENAVAGESGARASGSLNVPGIGNTLRLDLASLVAVYSGLAPASGVHVEALPIPNDQVFVGRCLSIQSVDFMAPSTLAFSNRTQISFTPDGEDACSEKPSKRQASFLARFDCLGARRV